MARGGRPHKFTKETLSRLYAGIRLGLSYEHAAMYAGISYDTYNNWVNGRFPRGVKKADQLQFFEDLTRAEGDAAARNMTLIQKAATDDWRAAAWILERRYPETYGKSVQAIEHSGTVAHHHRHQVEAKLPKESAVIKALPYDMVVALEQLAETIRGEVIDAEFREVAS